MLYVNAASIIEQTMFNHLQARVVSTQIDVNAIVDANYLNIAMQYHSIQTIVYSSLAYDNYKYLQSFEKEINAVDLLINYAIKQGVKKIIVLSYPGAFVNSDNLFLRYKGIIEKKFHESLIPITYLNVQAVNNQYHLNHNLHRLFYSQLDNAYIVPKKSNISIYSVSLNTLVDILVKLNESASEGHFDVFEKVQNLTAFLKDNSKNIPIQRIAPTYLYFKSFLGKYISPTMMELFLRTSIPMYSFRTEKEFGIDLKSMKSFQNEYQENTPYKVPSVFNGAKGYKLST